MKFDWKFEFMYGGGKKITSIYVISMPIQDVKAFLKDNTNQKKIVDKLLDK